MADNAGARSSSAARGGSNEEEDNSYLDALAGQFVARYGSWRGQIHKPQTVEDYAASLETSQTNTCTRIAAYHYQMKEGVVLNRITGLDSHVFACSWISPGDRRLCFHVNFGADTDTGVKKFFFAELYGTNRPAEVISCVMFDQGTKFSVHNCKFCTGMWHPIGGVFLGKK